MSELFMNCAMAFNRAAPSTMGTLLSGGMLAIAKQIGNQKVITIDQVVEIPGILANSISLRGKASVGDKTVLDALIPFSDKLKSVYNETMSIDKALTMATHKQTYIGMESTKGIIAKTGRAKWLAERNMEYPDAGSVLCYRIVKRIELTHKN
ncbi:MAG: dihydroxyacetone kinase subunit L [Lachnospiraceae bacterium]